MRLDDVTRVVRKTSRRVVSTVKKIFAGIFGFSSFALGALGVLFLFLQIPVIGATVSLFPLGIFLIVLAIPFLVFTILLLRSGIPQNLKTHHTDIKTCERLLSQIKEYLKNEHLAREFRGIEKNLKNELQNGKKIAKKIDSIVKTMMQPEWDVDHVNEVIMIEKRKPNPSTALIEKLEEQKKNIASLKEREEKLRTQIAQLRQNFNSIYTKFTLLDTSEIADFDVVETEIQKILDHKLKVAKFEEQLDAELNELK